jgi:hypothetical protein
MARQDAIRRKLNPTPYTVRKGALLQKRIGHQPTMAAPKSRIGWDLYLCGAGPSLAETHKQYLEQARNRYGASNGRVEVWGCNSAAPWLVEQGAFVTHAFGIDQTEGLMTEWSGTPPLKYIVASTVNPKTIRMLMAANRQLIWFHNYVGSQSEVELYKTIWPGSVMVGDGLNSVNRALCLAQFMGFRKIYVLGADNALRKDGDGFVMHPNGDHPEAHGATSVIMFNPEPLGGKTWYTKPDMLFSACQIAKWAARKGGQMDLVGDTLPHALLDAAMEHPEGYERFLENVAALESLRGVPTPGAVSDLHKPKGRTVTSSVFTVLQGKSDKM